MRTKLCRDMEPRVGKTSTISAIVDHLHFLAFCLRLISLRTIKVTGHHKKTWVSGNLHASHKTYLASVPQDGPLAMDIPSSLPILELPTWRIASCKLFNSTAHTWITYRLGWKDGLSSLTIRNINRYIVSTSLVEWACLVIAPDKLKLAPRSLTLLSPHPQPDPLLSADRCLDSKASLIGSK